MNSRNPGNQQPSEAESHDTSGGKSWVAVRLRRAIAFALQRKIVRAYLLYAEHRGAALADSVTYRTLFSVFAGVLLGFSLAALWLGGNPQAMGELSKTLSTVIPGLTDLIDVESIRAPTGFTVVGIISLVGLIGAAIGAISSLRIALRTLADDHADDSNFVWVIFRNLLVAVGIGLLLVIAAVLSVVSSVGIEAVAQWLGLPVRGDVTGWMSRVIGLVVVFAIDTAAIALMFTLLSGVAAPARVLWGGAALGGLGLTALQELSGVLVRGAASNPLLASFAALIALLLWLNLSAQVILIASSFIIVWTAETRDRIRERFGASTLAQHRRRRAEDRLQVATRDLRNAQEAARLEGLASESGGAH